MNSPTNLADPSGLSWLGDAWDEVAMVGSYVVNNPIGATVNFNVGQLQGANNMFVQPVYRTGQFAGDVVASEIDPNRLPNNPHLIGVRNGTRSVGGATFDVLLDGSSLLPLSSGVTRLIRGERAVVTAIGGSSGGATGRRILNETSVAQQPARNTCVPTSLDMLLEHHLPGRKVTDVSEFIGKLTPTGMHPTSAISFITENLAIIGKRVVRSDLASAVRSKQPFIAFVRDGAEGHALLVQSSHDIGGITYLLIRDPAKGAYLERLADFDARIIRDRNLLRYPTIRGE